MITIDHECFVSLEIAKLLKEAGFDWRCKYAYITTSEEDMPTGEEGILTEHFEDANWLVKAPTLEVAQRWLRETQKYQVEVLPNGLKGYATLCFLYKEPITQPFEHYSTYEEALEVGIKKVLELILEKVE